MNNALSRRVARGGALGRTCEKRKREWRLDIGAGGFGALVRRAARAHAALNKGGRTLLYHGAARAAGVRLAIHLLPGAGATLKASSNSKEMALLSGRHIERSTRRANQLHNYWQPSRGRRRGWRMKGLYWRYSDSIAHSTARHSAVRLRLSTHLKRRGAGGAADVTAGAGGAGFHYPR